MEWKIQRVGEVMNYFVYIKDLVGVKTNLESLSWVYGSVAPKADKEDYERCKIRVDLKVARTEDVFEDSFDLDDFDRYNYFYAQKDEKKIYYERTFLFNSRLRYSVEIVDDNLINVVVNKNYFKYIRYKFMNLHSLGYILTDLVSGLLLNMGYATLHCSAVQVEDKTLVIFGPPSTGKTITAIRLCETAAAKFISEDIALTDGKDIYSVPWTSTFRFYDHEKETRSEKMTASLMKKLPIFQLMGGKNRKAIDSYIDEDLIIDQSPITDIVVLGKGEEGVVFDSSDIYEDIINLNRYEFNYDKSPTMLVMNYFNKSISLEDMNAREKEIVRTLVDSCHSYRVFSNSALDYESILREEALYLE